ncbi:MULTISPECIES: DUF4129 domain-containing protein [unclassified Saccharicrinis]|uniref:DUF4129 domain-containing protein n=1 Tax=unclassified Saccharicrinis TaxID=2646859 RepID=UPI003D3497DD
MNSKSRYTILFLILLTLIGKDANAQDSAKVEAWDRSHVDYRPASIDKMEAYKRMPQYVYDRYEKPETWWEKFKRWFWSKILRSGLNGKAFLYVLMGMAVLILLFVILKLLGIKISSLFIFTGDSKVQNLSFKQGDDDIYNENLEKVLDVAIKNKAYREAVRVMYLLSLRHLDSSDLIEWKPWKTNKEYYYELKSGEHKKLFKRLVISYEYIWYGQFSVEAEKFGFVRSEFDAFERLIQKGKISA